MLDLAFFRDARFSSAALSIALVFFAIFGCLFFLTQYLQLVLASTRSGRGNGSCPSSRMAVSHRWP